MLSLHYLGGHDPRANLADEEALFERLRTCPSPAALFYVNNPCIILGRSNEPERWANAELAEADGIPVLRRFSGGGTVYQDERVLNFSFIVPKSVLGACGVTGGPQAYIDVFRRITIAALSASGTGFTPGGVSDVLLNGRKISGNAQRISRELVLHHGTLMLECPLAEIERYLPVPPNRTGISHRNFVTGLAEQGRPLAAEQAAVWLVRKLRHWLSGTW